MMRNLYLVFANWLLVLNTLLNTQSLGVALHVQKLLMTRSRVFRIQAGTYIWINSILIHKICPNSFLRARFRAKLPHAMLVGHFHQSLPNFCFPHSTSGSITSACWWPATNNGGCVVWRKERGPVSRHETRDTRHGGDWSSGAPLQHFLPVWWLHRSGMIHTDYIEQIGTQTVLVVVLPRFPPKSVNIHRWCFWFRCFEPLGPF